MAVPRVPVVAAFDSVRDSGPSGREWCAFSVSLRTAIGGTSVLALWLASATPAKADTCEAPDNEKFVQAKEHCLAIRTFPMRAGSDTLLVMMRPGCRNAS